MSLFRLKVLERASATANKSSDKSLARQSAPEKTIRRDLDAPRGRFYFCGTSHDGRGYRRVEGDPEHAGVRRKLDAILAKHPGLTADHPYFAQRKGARWLKAYQSPSAREKHLHNHKDYRFYDETQ